MDKEQPIEGLNEFYHFKFGTHTTEYTWFGGFGTLFTSRECGMRIGEYRKINNIMFYVWRIEKSWKFWQKPEIHWGAEEEFTMDWVRALKKHLFSC